jgi:predicted HAD superfamily Cof-like phosphohydrolase
MFRLVEEFNKEIVGIDRTEVQSLSPVEFKWLLCTFKEEIKELTDATDIVGQVDAIIDLIYFAAGGLTRMGISCAQAQSIFQAVHNCNMQKARGKKEGRAVEFDLDASKPIGWVPPEAQIKSILGLP